MKLEIQSVAVKNFLSFGSKLQEIKFEKGVNLVLGKDLATGRSNGSGKSTFLETIPFALFGQTHKDLKKDQLINWNNRKKTEVRLSFKKGSDVYTILRTMKPDNFEIYENDSLIEKESHSRDYQKNLEDIIGINFQAFGNLVHSNLNSSNRILDMKKPEKRKFIENVFGLLIYSHIDEKAHERIKHIETKLADLDSHQHHNKLNINGAVVRLENLNTTIKQIGSSETKLRDAQIEFNQLIENHPDIETKISKTDKLIIEIQNNFVKFEQIITNIDTKSRWLNRRIKESNDKLDELSESEQARKDYKKFVDGHGKPSEIMKQIDNLTERIEDIDKKKVTVSDKKTELLLKLENTRAVMEEKEKSLIDLKKHDICPTCKQKLKSGNTDVLKDLSDELADYRKELKKNNIKLTSETTKLNDLNTELHIKKKELGKLSRYRDELYQLKDKIKTDISPSELKSNIKRYKKTILKLDVLDIKIGKLKESINTKLQLSKERRIELDKIEKQINSKNREIENLEKDVENEQARKNEFLGMIKTEKESINKLTKENEDIVKQSGKYATLIDYLKMIREICKDDRIKQYAISSIMPYLNQQTNHYLSEVGYGFYTTLDRWLEAEIKGPGITNASYNSLSSGEKRGIDLSLQFALLDIARIQAGIWPDIIVMDEVLDSSVDSMGIDRLMQIIKVKQREEDNKIFIISHRDEISEDLEAERVYFAQKDRGFTHISIEDVSQFKIKE